MSRFVPTTTLRESVIAYLRAQIVSGAVASGEIYSAPSLAKELGISTTPVREALLELSRSGLLEPLRNRGFRVPAMTLQALDNQFDVRIMLESGALRAVAQKGVTDTASLVALADGIAQAVETEDVGQYIESDRRFHEALVSHAGNPLLTRMIMQLRENMRLYGLNSEEGRKRQRASVDEHYKMIELASKHQSEAIVTLIVHHIESWKALFAAEI